MNSPARSAKPRKVPAGAAPRKAAPKPRQPSAQAPVEDHRTRVGRERRERMRRHLLQSVTSVCSGRKIGGPAVIDDVVRHAKVSRGTFYKYFDSLEEAVSQVAYEMVDEMVTAGETYYGSVTDPVLRTATGFQAYLARAIVDHDWGAFVTHLDLLSGEDARILENMKRDMERGIETGDYSVKSIPVAADLLMGATIEGIRRIVADDLGATYMMELTELVLRALGVSPSKAEKVVRQSYDRLCALAPEHFSWWRPI